MIHLNRVSIIKLFVFGAFGVVVGSTKRKKKIQIRWTRHTLAIEITQIASRHMQCIGEETKDERRKGAKTHVNCAFELDHSARRANWNWPHRSMRLSISRSIFLRNENNIFFFLISCRSKFSSRNRNTVLSNRTQRDTCSIGSKNSTNR